MPRWEREREMKEALHVIGKGDLAILITDDGKAQGTSRDLSNVVDPAIV